MRRVTLTGATGLLGGTLIAALRERDVEVTVLTRDPGRAQARLGAVDAVPWEPIREPAPGQALAGRDAVFNLAGEPVAQRWSAGAKRAIRDSRVLTTRNLLAGLDQLERSGDRGRPPTLISSSAIGYYGSHGEEPLDEEAPAGRGFLAEVCADWEREAAEASELGMRVAMVRTGVVLAAAGGALQKMLPPFRIGVGGPVAGGGQYVSWIDATDVVGIMLLAAEDERWSGPVNATAPEPVTNRELSRALGHVLGRPAVMPVPGLALRLLHGEMAEIVTGGARVVPAKALVLGYRFRRPDLGDALRAAVGG